MLVPAMIAEAKRQGEPKLVYRLCLEAMQAIGDLDFAMHPDDYFEPLVESHYRLWWHQPDPTFKKNSDYRKWPEKDLIHQAAAHYLARPWMHHDYIDWCIVDALAYLEWQAFVYKLSMRVGQIWFWLGAAVLIMIANVTFGLFEGKDIHLALWTVGCLAVGIALVPPFVHFIHRRLLAAMNRAYQALDGAVLSASRVREEFLTAEKEGVVWPTGIWPILDAAIARSPIAWNASRRA
jgi:hypothetical protein